MISLIIGLTLYIIWAGPIITYLQEKDAGKKYSNLFQVYKDIYEQDDEILMTFLGGGFLIAVIAGFLWPVVLALAILAGTVYYIGSEPRIKAKSQEIIEKIRNIFQEEEKTDADDRHTY